MKKQMNKIFVIVIGCISLMSTASYGYQINDNLNIGVKAYLNAMQASGDNFNASKVGQDQANTNSSNANGVRLSRAYLVVMDKINDKFSGKFTLDEAYSDPTASNGRGNVFVKYLYGIYTPVKNMAIRFGLTETPWIPYEEGLWEYRFVSETAPDYEGFMPSSDLGLAVVGSLFDKLIDYHVMVSNGEGYQSQQNGRGYAGAARIALNVKPFIFNIFGMDENMHNGIPDYNPKRAIAMLVYSNSLLRVAGEWMWADDHITPADQGKAKFNHGYGYEFWGFLRIPGEKKLRIFARYLDMKPNGNNSNLPVSGKIAPTVSLGSSNLYSTELFKFVSTSENTWALAGISYDITKDVIAAIDYNFYTLQGYDLSKNKTTYNDQAVALNLRFAF
ncbi:MAG: OprO/OprP family phosphate-selective porin [Deltaproteobacteria bacterium]|nr:OprO/OprP family phosphate-selective porin [Deltaproteobacteria bacterium]